MIKIGDIYKKANAPVFSLEFFPPKTVEGEGKLFRTIEELKTLEPEFVSVTYGAGGSTRDKTFGITERIIKEFSLVAASHFTSVGADKDEILSHLGNMKKRGIDNIMVLRGDPPKGEIFFDASKSAFAHASDLVSFIKNSGYDFGLGGACYPEKHPEAASIEEDVRNLHKKVNAGVEFLITQLFFDNHAYYSFRDLVKNNNIHVPLVPGIMPVISYQQISRFREMAACYIPEDFVRDLTAVKDDQDRFMEISLAYSVKQCVDLLENGAPGIHFYTLNQSGATLEILKELRSRLLQK